MESESNRYEVLERRYYRIFLFFFFGLIFGIFIFLGGAAHPLGWQIIVFFGKLGYGSMIILLVWGGIMFWSHKKYYSYMLMNRACAHKFYAIEKRRKSRFFEIHLSLCSIFKNRKSNSNNNVEWHHPLSTYQEAVEFARQINPEILIRDCIFCNPNPLDFSDYTLEKTLIIKEMPLDHVWNAISAWFLHIGAHVQDSEEKPRVIALNSMEHYGIRISQQIELTFLEKNNIVEVNVKISPDPRYKYQSLNLKNIAEKPWVEQFEGLENFIKKSDVKIKAQRVKLVENIEKAFKNLYQPREPIFTMSEVVYQDMPKPQTAETTFFIIIAAVLFGGFYMLYYWFDLSPLINNAVYFIATYSIAVLFLFWVYRSDKYEREPFTMVLVIFAWGVFSGALAAPLNRAFGHYFEILGTRALVAAFVEEPIKALGLYLLISNRKYGKEFNTTLDGIVYGFAAGIGFFATENFTYFLQYGAVNLIIMSLYCWGHGVYSASVGLWLAIGKCKRGKVVVTDIIPGLLVACFMHFLWNGWGGWIGERAGEIIHYQAFFQLVYLLKIIREGLRDEILWGYSQGKAPS